MNRLIIIINYSFGLAIATIYWIMATTKMFHAGKSTIMDSRAMFLIRLGMRGRSGLAWIILRDGKSDDCIHSLDCY